MNLILIAELSEPPTDSLMFRYFTQVVKCQNFDVIIESEKDMIDLYFHYLKRKGMFDYIDDILPRPCRESGLKVDKIKSITFENIFSLLGQIGIIKQF